MPQLSFSGTIRGNRTVAFGRCLLHVGYESLKKKVKKKKRREEEEEFASFFVGSRDKQNFVLTLLALIA